MRHMWRRLLVLLCCPVASEAYNYGYEEVAKLTASDAAASDQFGYSVAIDGGTVVILSLIHI